MVSESQLYRFSGVLTLSLVDPSVEVGLPIHGNAQQFVQMKAFRVSSNLTSGYVAIYNLVRSTGFKTIIDTNIEIMA